MEGENLKHKTKVGLYWKLFDQFAQYGMQFVVGIVMARLLSPEDFGITALPAVFMAVASVFIEGGFGQALVRKPNLTEKDLSTSFYYSIIVGTVMYIILFLSSSWIAEFYDTPVLKDLIRVQALVLVWSPISTPQYITLTRRLDFKTMTRISIVNKIISSVLGISAAYAGYGLWALIVASLSSSLIGIIQICWIVKWYPTECWSRESFKYLWGYGNKMIVTSLLNRLFDNVAPVFIGKYYSPAALGEYNRAQGYAQLPSQQIVGVINGVTVPVLSKIQDDTEALARNYRKMLKVTAFIVFPLMMLLSALAHPLVIVMVTEKWESCVILLQLMCFSMMWYPVHSMNINLLFVKGRSDLFLRLEIVKKIMIVIVWSITLPQGLIVFICGNIATSYISLFLNTHYTGKLIGVGFKKQVYDLLPILLLSFLTFAASFGVIQFIDNLYLQILIGGVTGVIVYLGVAFICKMDQLQDVKYLLNRKA